MSGHTPGPWEAKLPRAVLGLKTDGRQWYIHAKDCTVACTLDGAREANAKLIAAAPMLLKALAAIVANENNPQSDADRFADVVRIARAAIASAA